MSLYGPCIGGVHTHADTPADLKSCIANNTHGPYHTIVILDLPAPSRPAHPVSLCFIGLAEKTKYCRMRKGRFFLQQILSQSPINTNDL